MAITLNFAGMTLKYPSGSGPAPCKGCGGKGYAWYGEGPDGKLKYDNVCFEDWNAKEPDKSIPCTKSLLK